MLSKKMRFILISTFMFAILVYMSGCVSDQVVEPFTRPNSLVRIINASPDASNPTVTIIDRDSVSSVFTGNVAFGNASAYSVIPSGNRKIIVTSGSNKKEEILAIGSDQQITIILRNSITSSTFAMTRVFERYTYLDEAARLDAGRCQVKFMNEITGGPAVLVKNDTTTTLIASLANLANGVSGLDGGRTYNFNFYHATSKAWLGKVTLTAAANTRYTVGLFGTTDATGIKNFSAKAFTDDNK